VAKPLVPEKIAEKSSRARLPLVPLIVGFVLLVAIIAGLSMRSHKTQTAPLQTETIKQAFSDYYRTTVLSEETNPNKLHDLKGTLDGYQVYAPEQVEQLVALYLDGAGRERLDPILDVWSAAKSATVPQYAAGSWGPRESDLLLERDGRQWYNP